MAPRRFPGPICQVRDWYEPIDEGTLPRVATANPGVVGSSGLNPEKPTERAIPRGECKYLVPPTTYTVRAPLATFERLRKFSSAAKISDAKSEDSYKWGNGATTPPALKQEIEIDGQKITLYRPADNELKAKNLPTVKQLTEALRAVPKSQRAYTNTVILSPVPSTQPVKEGVIAGEGDGGTIWLYPIPPSKEDDKQPTQKNFDNRVMHECGHNYQQAFWHHLPEEIAVWKSFEITDSWYVSRYAMDNPGDDFCEFLILYNTAKGTPCEETARKMYPNRWRLMQAYQAR